MSKDLVGFIDVCRRNRRHSSDHVDPGAQLRPAIDVYQEGSILMEGERLAMPIDAGPRKNLNVQQENRDGVD